LYLEKIVSDPDGLVDDVVKLVPVLELTYEKKAGG
jgi:hypothetical protein